MKYLLGILSVLLIFFSIIILTLEDEALILTTSPKIYSYKHTSETEVFYISLLASKNDPYYFNKESITSISLKEDEEEIPLSVKEIVVQNSEQEDFIVSFSLDVAFEANDYRISFEEAYLEITYSNNTLISLYIGEFNYMFATSDPGLTYHYVQGTYGYVDEINTVTAIVLELENTSDSNIVITDLRIFSTSVDIHNDYVLEVHQPIDHFDSVEDILQMNYHFFDWETTSLSLFVQSKEIKTLYCPLIYNGDIHYIHRFVIEITYLKHDEEFTMIIDDFPFMKTSIFGDAFVESYHSYEVD